MRMDKSKAAIIAIFALVIVCAGSFFAVRSINSRVKPKVAVTVTSMDAITVEAPSEQVSEEDATMPTFETAEPLATVPLSQLTTQDDNSERFTTFAVDTTESTTSFTLPEPSTQATTVTPAFADGSPSTAEQQAQQNIQRAALFSDGFLGYQFNKEGNYYFTTEDPWQRNFGFNVLYDMGAPFMNFYYDTIRCKFRYSSSAMKTKIGSSSFGKGSTGWCSSAPKSASIPSRLTAIRPITTAQPTRICCIWRWISIARASCVPAVIMQNTGGAPRLCPARWIPSATVPSLA